MRALLIGLAVVAAAAAPRDLLQRYEHEARSEDAAFTGFSSERGRALYLTERTTSRGQTVSCATCHTADPTQPGKTRANKRIDPLAPAANPARLTDPATVEKWFLRNCRDVLERPCTAREKGDFITYLLSPHGG
ncbi:MAG: DUF1924 domain-containing protein [Myxococcota bacterium]